MPSTSLADALERRILVIDGAMGTMVQRHRLAEADYRGDRFIDHRHPLGGNHDLLTLTRPQLIGDIHRAYLAAGADIIETNTFSSTRIAQADYGLEAIAEEMNLDAARLARACADEYSTPDRPRFVAGVLGPTNRTASLSPDVNDPGGRNVTFVALVEAYTEAMRGLLAGGVDLIMVETVFDTLNAKAAIFAIESEFARAGVRLPVMVSGTITDASGSTLSGQTPEAFWVSIAHAQPLIAGLNCALGAEQLRPHVESLAHAASCYVSVHPNAGLPNEFGGYDQSPALMAQLIGEFAASGLVNLVGGCCGTTPEHIEAIGAAVAKARPRELAESAPQLRLSGLEPLEVDDSSLFVNVGERTNVTGSARFKKLIREGALETALDVARDQVDNGAQIIDVNMDEGMLDGAALMTRFLNLVATEPDIARVPVMVDSSKWEVIEAGLRCIQGKPVVNSISLKEGEAEFIDKARRCRMYGAAVVVMAFDEKGQADTLARKIAICKRSYDILRAAGRLPAGRHHLRSEHLRDRDRHRRAQQLRDRFHRSVRVDQAASAPRAQFRRRQQRFVFVQRQRHRSRSDQRGVPVSRDPRRTLDGHRQRRSARHLRRDPVCVARSSRRRGVESATRCHRPTAGNFRRVRSALR